MANYCAIFGTIISLVGLVNIVIGSIVSRFVDVYLVQFADDIDDPNSNPIAGVGIYESFYNSGNVDDAIVAESGVPVDDFTDSTLSFNLLFPAQENFVVDLLPIDREVAAGIGLALGNPFGPIVEEEIVELIEVVENVPFDSCAQYVDDSETAIVGFFDFIQDTLVPSAFSLVAANVVPNLNLQLDALRSFENSTDVDHVPRNVVTDLLQARANAACGVIATDVFDVTDASCIAGELSAAAGDNPDPATQGVINIIGGVLTTCGNAGTSTISACLLEGIDFGFDADAPLIDNVVAEFGTNLCILPTCNALEYAGILAAFFNDIDAPSLAGPYATLALGFSLANSFFNGNTIGEATFLVSIIPEDLPDFFTDSLVACELFDLLGGLGLGVNTFANATCTFSNFFEGAQELLVSQNVDGSFDGLLGLLVQVIELYDICENNAPALQFCPTIFAQGLLRASLRDVTEVGDNFTETATLSCENDVTDNDKIETGQTILYPTYVLYLLAFLLPAVALCQGSAVLLGLGAVASTLAGALTLTALLIVRSAPVYDAVGVEPNADFEGEDEDAPFVTFFVQGPIAVLLTATLLMMIFNGVILLVAMVLQCREIDGDYDEYDVDKKEVDIAPQFASPAEDRVVVTDVKQGKNFSI